jgi:RNA polymerase sigma-70 factor (ECF subfamily)
MPAPTDHRDLVDKYGRLVSSICWRMTRNEERAREAAQQVWLELLESLPRFEGRSELSTWIYQLTWRVARRHTRDERRYSIEFLRAYFSGPDLPLPEQADLDKRLWVKSMCDKCLAGMLQCLEPEPRLAFILREMAEVDYAEIARVLECEEATARQHVSRSRRKLNGFLADQCVLHNPAGTCRCRMRRHVDDVDLPKEYAKLRRSTGLARLFRESEQVLPPKNFWLELLESDAAAVTT